MNGLNLSQTCYNLMKFEEKDYKKLCQPICGKDIVNTIQFKTNPLVKQLIVLWQRETLIYFRPISYFYTP